MQGVPFPLLMRRMCTGASCQGIAYSFIESLDHGALALRATYRANGMTLVTAIRVGGSGNGQLIVPLLRRVPWRSVPLTVMRRAIRHFLAGRDRIFAVPTLIVVRVVKQPCLMVICVVDDARQFVANKSQTGRRELDARCYRTRSMEKRDIRISITLDIQRARARQPLPRRLRSAMTIATDIFPTRVRASS
jgi:hypothetical protein